MAGVIRHKATHVSCLHIERWMVNSYGLALVFSMALGENPGQIRQIVVRVPPRGR